MYVREGDMQSLLLCVCLFMGKGDRAPAHNNTACVNVREGES